MIPTVIALVIIAEIIGLYWWRKTSKKRARARGGDGRRAGKNKVFAAARDSLLSLNQAEGLPRYPDEDDGDDRGAVTFYTIVRGDASKVAEVISDKYCFYEETSARQGDKDAVRAAQQIEKMLKSRSHGCQFHWGTNTVEYKLFRDRNDEYMFVEITRRLR